MICLLVVCSCALCYAQHTDIDILKAVYLHRNDQLRGGVVAVTNSTYPISYGVPLAVTALGYFKHDSNCKRAGLTMVVATAGTFLATFSLKRLIQRERPYERYSYIIPHSKSSKYSFPSGHTSAAFTTCTYIFLQTHKWYYVAPAFGWAVAVGYSRMYLGEHYPSDVLAGAALGTAVAWLTYKGENWIQKRRAKHWTPEKL